MPKADRPNDRREENGLPLKSSCRFNSSSKLFLLLSPIRPQKTSAGLRPLEWVPVLFLQSFGFP